MTHISKIVFTVLGFVIFMAGVWLANLGSDDMEMKPRQVTLTDVSVTFESVKDDAPSSTIGSFVDTQTGRSFKASINDATYVHFKVASNQPLSMVKEVSVDTVYGVNQGKYTYVLGIFFKFLGALVIVTASQIWLEAFKTWRKGRKQSITQISS